MDAKVPNLMCLNREGDEGNEEINGFFVSRGEDGKAFPENFPPSPPTPVSLNPAPAATAVAAASPVLEAVA